ncbi:MAG: hypothetical protein WDW38_003556 [Sanguina aurantia]
MTDADPQPELGWARSTNTHQRRVFGAGGGPPWRASVAVVPSGSVSGSSVFSLRVKVKVLSGSLPSTFSRSRSTGTGLPSGGVLVHQGHAAAAVDGADHLARAA